MGILPMDHGLEARATSFGHFGTLVTAEGGFWLAMTRAGKMEGSTVGFPAGRSPRTGGATGGTLPA